MLEWLDRFVLFMSLTTLERFSMFLFAVFGLLMVFFLVSRRMNARAEAPAPAPRLLAALARALRPTKSLPRNRHAKKQHRGVKESTARRKRGSMRGCRCLPP